MTMVVLLAAGGDVVSSLLWVVMMTPQPYRIKTREHGTR